MSLEKELLELTNKRLKETKSKDNAEIAPIDVTKPVIAPVNKEAAKAAQQSLAQREAKAKEQKEKNATWFQKGGFEQQGYQGGDFATVIDATRGVARGVLSQGEGIVDFGAHLISRGLDAVNLDKAADTVKNYANMDVVGEWEEIVDETKFGEWVNENSLLGSKADVVPEAIGSVGFAILTAGSASGLGKVGATVATSAATFASSAGSGISEAYNSGATDGEAWAYGVMAGTVEAGTELLSGGLGNAVTAIGISRGIGGLDDIFAKKIASKIENVLARNIVEGAVKVTGEGLEEVIAALGNAVAKKLTYMSDEQIQELIKDEKVLESFVVGIIAAGVAEGGSVITSTKQGRDLVTGLTKEEQSVVDAVYKKRIEEATQNGENLNGKQKNEIYEKVVKDLENGQISVETIEEVLGGESYKNYKDAVDSEKYTMQEMESLRDEYVELNKIKNSELTGEQTDRKAEIQKKLAELRTKYESSDKSNLKAKLNDDVYKLSKGTKLENSYIETAKKGEAYKADLSKYDKQTQATIQRAMDSGVLNNTQRTHEFVETMAAIERRTGIAINFANNAKLKEMGYYVKGATVNGVKTDSGMILNVDSNKALETTVGHEIMHFLEGDKDGYKNLKKLLFDMAKSKGEYDSRLKALEELYKNVDNVDIEAELAADLVGDYLFSDPDFIKNLLTEDKNLFHKIWREIKDLLKIVTPGTKEAKQLEKVKNEFKKVFDEYKASGETTAEGEAKFSVSKNENNEVDIDKYTEKQYNDFGWVRFNVLSSQENADFKTKFAEAIADKNRTPDTIYGDYIIACGALSGATEGVNNKLVYAKGNKKNLQDLTISRVVELSIDNETDIELVRNFIVEGEQNGNTSASLIAQDIYGKETVTINTKKDFPSYQELKRKSRGGAGGSKSEGNTSADGIGNQRNGALEQAESNEIAPTKVSSKDGAFFDAKNKKFSLTEYTPEEKKSHNDVAIKHFGRTYKWAETGYLLLNGTRLDMSGKHDGAPGGYRTVDHRDIREALGYDYGGDDYSGAMVQFMSEGNIRIVPEIEGINLSVKPTQAQEQALADYISRNRGEVILDIDDLDGNTVASVEYNRGTSSAKILTDIREWFDKGIKPENSVNYSLTKDADIPQNQAKSQTPATELRYEGKDISPLRGNPVGATETVKTNKNTTPKQKPVESKIEGFTEDYAPMTEADAEAMRSESFGSLSDADVPSGEYAPFYADFERQSYEVGKITADNISRKVAKEMGLDATDRAKMKELIQRYSKDNSITEQDLFDEIKREFHITEEYNNAELADVLESARQHMRGTKVYIDPTKKADFKGMGYNSFKDFKNDHFGHFYITTQKTAGALSVDALYQELSGLYPGLFPEGEWNTADQLKIMGDVADNATAKEYREGEYDDYTIQRAVDLINSELSSKAEEGTLTYLDEARQSYFDDIAPVANAPVKQTTAKRAKRVDAEEAHRGGEKERSWYETSTTSEAVDNMITPDDIPNDVRYYQVKSNKKTLAAANAMLEKNGYENSKQYFKARMETKKLNVEDIALGERLIQEAAKSGDAEGLRELIVDVSVIGTELGQKVQALSLIRRLSPEGQLLAMTRTVERGQKRGDKSFEGVEITDDMSKRITDVVKPDGTYDQAELNAAVEEVKQQIADQMNVSFREYLNGWRYLSMLGNPKTHIRNVVSNAAMFGTRAVKNAIARSAEDIFLKNRKTVLNTDDIGPVANFATEKASEIPGQRRSFSEGQPARTKTWKRATDVVKDFAKKTTTEMEADITGGAKYSDEASIKAKRKIFKTKAGNFIDDINFTALEMEDAFFSRSTFKLTFQEYLTANGITTEADIKNNPELIEKAKDYALEEAKRATFRQDSYIADKISKIEKHNVFNELVIGSVMPFKKTPINVAKTGLAYSPLGFARNVYDFVQVKKGNMDITEAIDHVGQTLTGTSLSLIGFALASAGVLNGAGEDDKEGQYDYQLGEQAYSFNFNGNSYSLSWLSPVAMPLFVGANAYEQFVEKEDLDMNIVTDALGQTLDPLSEMSFLSGLDDVLSSYESGMGQFFGAAGSMVQNYATQFIPTISSQLAATLDDTKRTTKASKDSGWAFGEETLNKVMYKIPGLRNFLEPSTDIWGNEVEQSDNFFVRGFESFINPANKREGITSDVDVEIKDLYGETGDSSVVPSIPYNYLNYNGKKYEMSSKEFTEYKKTYGQTAYDLLDDLFETETYKNATSEERADMVKRVYDYARDEAKREYFKGVDLEYTNATKDGVEYYKENAIKEAIAHDMTAEEYEFYSEKPAKHAVAKSVGGYKAYKSYQSALSDIKADNGVSGSRKRKVIQYINELDISFGEKLILFKNEYPADNTYNQQIIQYLKDNDDISSAEMKQILVGLGFTVTDNGKIYWN